MPHTVPSTHAGAVLRCRKDIKVKHMRRRDLLLGTASMLTLPKLATARLSCQDLPNGMEVCTVDVDLGVLNTAYQQRLHWCWAACIQAIFEFHGHTIGQARIVEKIYGNDLDMGAFGPQIIAAINGEWTDEDGDVFDAAAEVLWDTQFGFGRPDAIVQAARELEADNPLILGALGHTVLLTAMTYAGNAFGVQIERITIRDPWPLNPNRRFLTALEAIQTQFLAKVEVS